MFRLCHACIKSRIAQLDGQVENQEIIIRHQWPQIAGMEETLARDALCEQTSLTEVGDYNLLLTGLKEFEEVLKARKSVEGK